MSAKWGKLLDTLIELTEAGKISWQANDWSGDFEAELGKHQVKLEEELFGEQFKISLMNFHREVVDSFTDEDLTDQGFSNAFSKFNKLQTSIRRQLNGSEAALEEVLKDLQDIKDLNQ